MTVLIATLFDKVRITAIYHRLSNRNAHFHLLPQQSLRSPKELLYIPDDIAANKKASNIK